MNADILPVEYLLVFPSPISDMVYTLTPQTIA